MSLVVSIQLVARGMDSKLEYRTQIKLTYTHRDKSMYFI